MDFRIDYKNTESYHSLMRISFTDQKKRIFHKQQKIGVEQVIVLSTYNRSEFIIFVDEQTDQKYKIYTNDMFDKPEIETTIRHF